MFKDKKIDITGGNNSLPMKIIKSLAIFFIGFPFVGTIIGELGLPYLITKVGEWGVLIGSIYLIYKIWTAKGGGGNVSNKNKTSTSNSNGIVLGKSKGSLITKPENEDGHVAIIGGAGTGKSTSVSIPTLLSWKASALVMDIKGDLSQLTSNYRERELGNKVFIFDPDSPDCACYDPLEQVTGIDSANELARNIIPTPIKGDKFWSNNAQAILASAVLQGKLERNELFSDICQRILTTKPETLIEELTSSTNTQVKLLASACNGMPEKTLGGVFSELRVHLLTFASDEKIRRATRKTSWTPQDLENEDGTTVYLRINEKMIAQYKGLISCMISQILRYLSSRGEGKQPSIMMLLDELPRLGRVDGLIEGLGTLRSRNVHIVPMVQSLSDLDRHYGQDERKILLDNCPYRLVLGVGDYDTQKYFSDLSGTQEIWQKSYNHNWIGLRKGNTQSLVEKKIIKPERFGQLKGDKKAILFGFKYPMELDKAFWYETSSYKRLIETYKL